MEELSADKIEGMLEQQQQQELSKTSDYITNPSNDGIRTIARSLRDEASNKSYESDREGKKAEEDVDEGEHPSGVNEWKTVTIEPSTIMEPKQTKNDTIASYTEFEEEDFDDEEEKICQELLSKSTFDSEEKSVHSGAGGAIMNDKMSALKQRWSNQDNILAPSPTTPKDLRKEEKIPNFQPGDHVVRWKMIKLMLYPIQIHGIILSVDKHESGTKVVLADFGMSSSQARKKNGLEAMNKTMNTAVLETTKAMSNLFGVGNPQKSHSRTSYDSDIVQQLKSKGDNKDEKRFHIRTITNPDDLRKWSKVNYGQSLFSTKGKLDQLKKMFTIPVKKSQVDNTNLEHVEDSTMFDENDDFFKTTDNDVTINNLTNDPSYGEKVEKTTQEKDKVQQLQTSSKHTDLKLRPTTGIPASVAISSTSDASTLTKSDLHTLEQMIAEANEIDRRERSRRIFRGKPKQSMEDVSVASHSSSVSFSNHFLNINPQASFNRIKDEAGTLLKKLSFQRPESTAKSEDDTKSIEKEDNGPKLPKSDHRSIVLARVRFILAEQEKPESESRLPPYHIFYSNSECIAVWCKTGKFCTLQAAVFLHSTAICNVKSTVMLTAGVAATQPWLIPVVGVYGLVAVGMPYVILNKCQKKWKDSEQVLTDGFWAEAENEVIVTAVEQWSELCPAKRINTDEIGIDI